MSAGVTVDFEDLESLEVEWKHLFSESGCENPFLTWSWMRAWRGSPASGGHASAVVVRRGGEALAIAAVQRRAGLVRLFCDDLFADYAGILVRPGEARTAAHALARLGNLRGMRSAEFRPMRSVDLGTEVLEAGLAMSGMAWRRTVVCGNPRVPTTGDFAAYLKRRDKRLRQEIRTTENHLDRQGGWSFRVAGTAGEAHRYFDALVEFHMKRQGRKVGNSIFDDSVTIRFYRSLIDGLGEGVAAELSALEFAGRPVSVAYSLRCGQTLYYWIPSFDSSIRSVSLGKLHIKCLIEACHQDGTHWFDFMGGDEPYKHQWADGGYEVLRYDVYRDPFSRSIAHLQEEAHAVLRRAVKRWDFLGALWRRISKLLR